MDDKKLVKIEPNILDAQGQLIYQTNKHYQRLANVMEHPEFRQFFNEYMQDWETAKTILLFMKLYSAIEKCSQIELTPYQKIAIVKDVLDDPEARRKVCDGMMKWSNDKNTL